MKRIFIGIFILTLAASLYLGFSVWRSRDDISQADVARIANSSPVAMDGITENTRKVLKDAPALNRLRGKIKKKDELEILESGALIAAKSVQSRISNPYDKEANEEAFAKSSLMIDCFDVLWPDGGLESISEVINAPVDSPERKALLIIASRQFAMRMFHTTNPPRETCLEAMGKK